MRNYRAGLAKWQTADPLGYPDGWNQLAYCGNGVVSSLDFLGCSGVTTEWAPYQEMNTRTEAAIEAYKTANDHPVFKETYERLEQECVLVNEVYKGIRNVGGINYKVYVQ